MKTGEMIMPNYTVLITEDNQKNRAAKVRDFIAGMTDDFFLSQAKLLGCNIPIPITNEKTF